MTTKRSSLQRTPGGGKLEIAKLPEDLICVRIRGFTHDSFKKKLKRSFRG